MRKKLFLTSFLLMAMFAAYAAEASYTGDVSNKLGRGLGNVLYSPFEIPHRVSTEMVGEDYVYAFPKGLVKGAFHAVGRAVVGVYETVTFVVPQQPIIPDFNEA